MKIKVDRARCYGHARCVAKGPNVFRLDDDGYSISDGFDVAEHLEDQAHEGAAACPERCITLIE